MLLGLSQSKKVSYGASNDEIGYVAQIHGIPSLEGYMNYIIGSDVMAIFLSVRILPVGGVAPGRVCGCTLHGRLVFTDISHKPEELGS